MIFCADIPTGGRPEKGETALELKKTAVAGTLESSDVMVTAGPNPGKGIEIRIDSAVKAMFGDAILKTVETVLSEMDVKDALMELNDKGAIDCVIRARVSAAICRATETKFNWEGEDCHG